VKELRDPRFAFVTITEVELAKDYSIAKIFITLLNDSKKEETIRALNKASGFLRYHLAHNINMRTTPKLRFLYDESVERGRRISKLLKEEPPDTNSSNQEE
jgi:ribosome-binding factor A